MILPLQKVNILCINNSTYMDRSPGVVVKGETRNQKVVSSNPGTGYWMDIFSHLFVVIIVMCV